MTARAAAVLLTGGWVAAVGITATLAAAWAFIEWREARQ